MRKIILPLLVFLTINIFSCRSGPDQSLNASGRCDKYRLHILHYQNASGERGITTDYYTAAGVNDRAVWELLDGTRNSLNFHTFDSAGNMIQNYREFMNGLTTTETYRYNSIGQMATEIFDRSDGVYGETEYTYNDQGREKAMHCERYKGWLTCDITFEHDISGRKILGIIWDDSTRAGQIDYGYDENGCLRTAHWSFEGGWSQTFTYQYEKIPEITYTTTNPFVTNNNRFRVSGEAYDYSGKMGGPSYYEYDQSGKLNRKHFVRTDGLETRTTYQYAPSGILVSSKRKYSDDATADFQYHFDEQRRFIGRSFAKSDGTTGSDSYTYNNRGELARAVYDNFDGWLTGNLKFEHDNLGTLTSGHYAGVNGLNADLSFDHDQYRNITRIHWEFSNGKTQTYEFQYSKLYEDMGPGNE